MTTSRGPVRVEAVGRTDVGCVRTNNEDAFVIADLTADVWEANRASATIDVGERGVLLAVSDGMGGAAAGEVASALVVESLRGHLGRAPDDPSAVSSAVEKTNRDVWVAGQLAGTQGMGATLTAVIVRGERAHIASVGDSRAYIIRENRIRQITKDQTYVALLIEQGVPPEDVRNSPFRNMILQAMGTRPNVVVALGEIALRRDDVFVLCSDGLWSEVGDEEVFKVVRAEAPDAACARLVELAKERGGRDNITVVLAKVMGDGLPKPPQGERVTETYQTLEAFDPKSLL